MVTMQNFVRELADLASVGPAMLRDFRMLGVKNVVQLAREDPDRPGERAGPGHDPPPRSRDPVSA